jgi:predicted nucleic acid-binding protein
VLSAIRIHREFDVPYWDALIAATMRENGVTRIYTEDEKSFRKIPWLEVVNPLGKGREGSRQSKTGGT